MYDAERGLFDLRQGRPLYVSGSSDAGSEAGALVATVDTVSQRTLETLGRLDTAPRLVVTHHRANAMGIGNGGPSRDVSLGLNGATQPEQILHLCTAAGRFDAPDLDPRPATSPESGGLTLARLAGLLPAIIGVSLNGRGADGLGSGLASGEILSVTTAQVEAFAADERVEVTHVSDGPVPLEHAEDARFMVFRTGNSFREHVAVMIGDPAKWPDPVPVRLHSACLTGDLFGSLRCDCGEQLRGSLRVFTASGGGVLLYLAQEGRGIGLGNKMRAYSLQHTGLDTVDADEVLGFGDDERGYHAAVEMLRHIGVERVILLTNNPLKVAALRDEGIDVVERKPLFGTLNRHNLPYVKAKVDRAGHWLTTCSRARGVRTSPESVACGSARRPTNPAGSLHRYYGADSWQAGSGPARSVGRPEQVLHHQVAGHPHAQAGVGGLGDRVLAFHVEPQPHHARIGGGQRLQMLVQRAADAPAPVVGVHVHALDPPDVAVAPVAPLVRVHHLADDAAVRARDVVGAARRARQQPPHPVAQGPAIEAYALALVGEAGVEVDDRVQVVESRLPDRELAHLSFRFAAVRRSGPWVTPAGPAETGGHPVSPRRATVRSARPAARRARPCPASRRR